MKLGRIVCGVLIIVWASAFLPPLKAGALGTISSPDWISKEPMMAFKNEITEARGLEEQVPCIARSAFQIPLPWGGYSEKRLCVMRGLSFNLAMDENGDWMFISMKGSNTYLRISKSSWSKFYVIPNTDSVVVFQKLPNTARLKMMIQHNFLAHLQPLLVGELTYDGMDGEYPAAGEEIVPSAWGISKNNKYLVYSYGLRYAQNDRVAVVDLDTGHTKVVGSLNYGSYYSSPAPLARLAISDDAGLIIAGGPKILKIWSVAGGCGVALTNNQVWEGVVRDFCPNALIAPTVYGTANGPAYDDSLTYNFNMSFNAESLTFTQRKGWNDGYYTYSSITLRPYNITLPQSLKYLALGDSFASGEGDLSYNDATHYIPGTEVLGNYARNIPQEMCHISSRSYPFLIAANMSYSPSSSMRSVACSGAVRNDVLTYDTNNFSRILADNYQGQGKNHDGTVPRLAGISNMVELQDEARRDILPGRVQQIEHVQRTQPEAVTIMMGGNDLGFAEIMKGCLMNGYSLDRWSSDCDATSPRGKRVTANAIKALYPQLKHMYENINKYTLGKKVFVIGYPHFFSEDWFCVELAGKMTRSERVAINQMIDYANETIKNAALDAGVKYIDITNALSGRELCGASSGVTGFDDLALQGFMSELMRYRHATLDNIARYGLIGGSYVNSTPFFSNWYTAKRTVEVIETGVTLAPAEIFYSTLQQAVHPNSVGHRAIYTTIKQGLGEELLDSDRCNNIVICPADGASTAERGIPNPEDYIDGMEDKSNRARFVNGVSALLQNGVARNVIQTGKEVLYTWALDAAPDAQIDRSLPVTLSIHSDPRVLGVMRYAGSTRRFELAATLPESFPAGAHTLHISAISTDGTPLDIVKNIFVVGPEGDLDNDGMDDDKDMCAFGVSNGVDVDHDNIADNCDLHVEASSAPKSTNDVRVTAPSGGGRELTGVIGGVDDATPDLWIRNGADTERGVRLGAALPLATDGVEMGERQTEPMVDNAYRPFWWPIWLLLALIAVLTGWCIVRRIRARA